MLKRNTPHWTNFPEFDCSLFFVQRLDELLFDYTIDTYKHQALNTFLLVREALAVYEIIDQGYSDSQNIKSIIEELNFKYSFDPIAKKILNDEFGLYLPITDFENNTENKLKLELIKNKLKGSLYVDINKELLIEAIVSKSKKDISFLTSNLITTLKAAGYSQPFLYKKNSRNVL